jgi:hypothetical protein
MVHSPPVSMPQMTSSPPNVNGLGVQPLRTALVDCAAGVDPPKIHRCCHLPAPELSLTSSDPFIS